MDRYGALMYVVYRTRARAAAKTTDRSRVKYGS